MDPSPGQICWTGIILLQSKIKKMDYILQFSASKTIKHFAFAPKRTYEERRKVAVTSLIQRSKELKMKMGNGLPSKSLKQDYFAEKHGCKLYHCFVILD